MDLLTVVVISPSGAVLGSDRSAVLEKCRALYEKITAVALGVWTEHGYQFRHCGHTG